MNNALPQDYWLEDPDPTVELRETWELDRTPDDWLAGWADRIQDAPETEPSTVELEQLALDWAVPVEFLRSLLSSEVPSEFLRTNRKTLAKAADTRFNQLHS